MPFASIFRNKPNLLWMLHKVTYLFLVGFTFCLFGGYFSLKIHPQKSTVTMCFIVAKTASETIKITERIPSLCYFPNIFLSLREVPR